jgi:glycosyltransferase involved in cell wall biosynthesis
MKITFLPVQCSPFHGETLNERPMGGIETGVIRLAAALQGLGNDVTVLTEFTNPPDTIPRYLPVNKLHELDESDVLIVVRGWKGAYVTIPAKRKFFWTGDAYFSPVHIGIGDLRFSKRMDGLLAVSHWHANTLCQVSGFPLEKAFVLRNGIHGEYFRGSEQRNRKRLIYSSTPFRGLIYLPQIFESLKKKHPDLELHVFSSLSLYQSEWPAPKAVDYEYEEAFEILNKMPGCYVSDSILQKQLAREFMKSSILTYPNIFEETSCITAMEAQAAGCAIVTSALGALPETVEDSGILIPIRQGPGEYLKEFIAAVDRILTDDELFLRLSENGKKRAETLDWSCRAQEFMNYLKKFNP